MLTQKMQTQDNSRVVKLNIGGKQFITTTGTLTGNGTLDNYFHALLSGSVPSTQIDGDWYFIDRNGALFAPVLEYLRTGEWFCPPHLPEKLVLREAEFYCIEGLEAPVKDGCKSRMADAIWVALEGGWFVHTSDPLLEKEKNLVERYDQWSLRLKQDGEQGKTLLVQHYAKRGYKCVAMVNDKNAQRFELIFYCK